MRKPPTGAIIAVAIGLMIAVILIANLQSPSRHGTSSGPSAIQPQAAANHEAPPAGQAEAGGGKPVPFLEHPIGNVSRNQMSIAAVWLPPIQMDHDPGVHHAAPLPEDPDVIHLEADVHAERGNLNGFGFGEWIPYLGVEYELVFKDDPSGQPRVAGKMMPMVAKDGPHYGATIPMPRHGTYRLTYRFEPPSVNGFGRHTDPVTGVAPWWEPFSVEFEFTFNGSPQKKP